MVATLVLAGCGRPAPPLKVWAAPIGAPVPSGAYAELLAIGNEVEAEAAPLLTRTEFFPKQRARAAAVCNPKMARLARAAKGDVDFAYAPRALDVASPGRRGWRLIGRHLAWSLEDEVKAGQLRAAVNRYGLATRFGFDLTGGGAADLSLGLAIADDARRTIAPAIDGMDASTLDALASEAEIALAHKPALMAAVRNETANMRLLLQRLQDAYASNRLPEEAKALGGFVADDAAYVQGLSSGKAAVFFNDLGEEIDDLEKELGRDTTLAAPNRTWEFESKGSRGRMLRRAVLGGVEPILSMNDVTLARTRLLIAQCRLRSRVLKGQALPRRLEEIAGRGGKSAFADPFSGYDLVYRRNGKEFSVYSVGHDGKDDGGESDVGGLAPDLRLENAP